MKYLSKLFVSVFIIFVALFANSEPDSLSHQPTKLYVRVLLEEKQCSDQPLWEISAEDKLLIINMDDTKHRITAQKCTVTAPEKMNVIESESNMLNNIEIARVFSRDGYICINGTWYQGSLYICVKNNKVMLVNKLDLEDYIFSVIKSEGWPGWPLEVNKVFAIACRSYVIAKVLDAQQQNRIYHIKNTNVHQRYNGYHESLELRRAVDETRDIFLAFDGQPILAMFDICCGGVIPAKKKGVNFNHAPYLKRKYACTYCKPFKVYNWSAAYTLEEIEKMFQTHIPDLKKLKEIKVTKKDDAGLVEEVVLKASSGYHYVKGKKVYSTLKKVRSLCFATAKKKGKTIEFKGRGFGHHMGLCQWGTRRMVQEGWTFDRILTFFYPGTTFMRLNMPEKKEQVYA